MLPKQEADLPARYERLKLLYEVSCAIHAGIEPRQALQRIVDEAVRIMRATSGSLALLNPNTHLLEIEAFHGLPDVANQLKLRLGEGITGWVVKHGKPIRLGDAESDPRYIMVRKSVKSELAVPLEVNGEIRGVLNVDSETADAFTAADQELLEELAVQAARVIRNVWTYQQLHLKAALFETLIRVTKAVNSEVSLDDVLSAITREACELMNAKMASLLLLDESGEWLDLRASHGAGEHYLTKPHLGVNESLLGIVLRRRKPLQVENVQTSTRYQSIEIARREGLVSLLGVPLMYSGKKAIGTLSVYKGHPHSFSNEEVRMLSTLAEFSAIAIDKARLYERIVDVEEMLRDNEKLSAIGLLAAEVAHEIRNPLTVMKMLYHSLDLSFPEGDPRNTDARIMGEKMDHLNKIVEQILDFARRADPRLISVSVNRLIGDLGLLTRHKLKNQNIHLIRDLDPELPDVLADPTQLEQIFLNLTLNAAEAMEEGGTLTISTRLPERPAGHVQIEFKDSGQGMTEEQVMRAFTVLLSTKTKGNGFGLAIVKRIVEAHHGRIHVKSRLGKGTTVTIDLPLTPPATS